MSEFRNGVNNFVFAYWETVYYIDTTWYKDIWVQ